jgi:hypothetical protein
MRALGAGSGRGAHWYDVCEHALRKELDVAPSLETRRLYRELGLHGVAPDLAPDERP